MHTDGLTGQGSQGASGWGLWDLSEHTTQLDGDALKMHIFHQEAQGRPASLNPRPLSLLKKQVDLVLKVRGS